MQKMSALPTERTSGRGAGTDDLSGQIGNAHCPTVFHGLTSLLLRVINFRFALVRRE